METEKNGLQWLPSFETKNAPGLKQIPDFATKTHDRYF